MFQNETETDEVETDHLAAAGRLLVALYAQAIDGLNAAAVAAERGRVMDRLEATIRCSEAICQLHLGLDMERGGEIAANLDQLYRFIQAQVPQVNLRNDAALARQLAGLLEPLIESWTEVVAEVGEGTRVATPDNATPSLAELTSAGPQRVACL